MFRNAVICLAVSASFSALTYAQGNDPGMVGRFAMPPSIYRLHGVPRSLELTEEQLRLLNRVSSELERQYGEKVNALDLVPEASRLAAYGNLNWQYANEWMAGAKDIFNDDRLMHYRQLQLQYGRYKTFGDPDILRTLKLDEQQENVLRNQRLSTSPPILDANREAPLVPPAVAPAKGRRLYNEYEHRSPEPQIGWKNKVGEPYGFLPTFTSVPQW